jgi:hypothetical protein
MKISSFKLKIALVSGAAALLAIFITHQAFSQEPAKKESSRKIVLKIVSDDNGKMTVIDTTIIGTDDMMMDSINEEISKVIELNKDGRHMRVKVCKEPDGFNYNYELPCTPECMMDLERLEDLELPGMDRSMRDFEFEGMPPGAGLRIMRSGGNGQSLNDLLGNIPMDRVVSYSIKDRKHGKRIVIDLDDAPAFERQDRVIVIREPGRMRSGRNHPDRRVRVIMNSEDGDEKMDKSVEQLGSQVPPPPPPPPPDKKNK